MNDELSETRSLLHETISLLKLESERHINDLASLRVSFNAILKGHQEEMEALHQLLRESEARMSTTNEMVQKLSQTCSEMVRVNSDLKDSYVSQFERATSMNNHLIEEASKMREENQAYYNAIKQLREEVAAERSRYDRMMEQMVSMVCSGGSRSPLVAIDQK